MLYFSTPIVIIFSFLCHNQNMIIYEYRIISDKIYQKHTIFSTVISFTWFFLSLNVLFSRWRKKSRKKKTKKRVKYIWIRTNRATKDKYIKSKCKRLDTQCSLAIFIYLLKLIYQQIWHICLYVCLKWSLMNLNC